MREFNIVLAGIGGQGILLAAEILGTAALKEGLNVRVSEIHGMAQRGGAVFSAVRIGENVLAPTVLDGQADILLEQANIPRRYAQCTFDNFEIHNDSHRHALKISKQFVKNYPVQDVGLLYIGPCGVGKTHLAIATIQELIKEKKAETTKRTLDNS